MKFSLIQFPVILFGVEMFVLAKTVFSGCSYGFLNKELSFNLILELTSWHLVTEVEAVTQATAPCLSCPGP